MPCPGRKSWAFPLLVTGHKCPKIAGGGVICMGAQTRTDVLPYISLIPFSGTSTWYWVLIAGGKRAEWHIVIQRLRRSPLDNQPCVPFSWFFEPVLYWIHTYNPLPGHAPVRWPPAPHALNWAMRSPLYPRIDRAEPRAITGYHSRQTTDYLIKVFASRFSPFRFLEPWIQSRRPLSDGQVTEGRRHFTGGYSTSKLGQERIPTLYGRNALSPEIHRDDSLVPTVGQL